MRNCKYPRRISKPQGLPQGRPMRCPNRASPETSIRFYQSSQNWITWLTIWPSHPQACNNRASKPASGSIQDQYKAHNPLRNRKLHPSQSIAIQHNPTHLQKPPIHIPHTIKWQSASAPKHAVATTGPSSNSTSGLWSSYRAQQHVWGYSPGS